MNTPESSDPACEGIVCMDCGDRLSSVGSFLRWHKMYFCNRTCITVYLMDKARECAECKTKISPDLLGNRTRRIGNGSEIVFFCSADCITKYNRNLTNDFYDTNGSSTLDSQSFYDIWNNIFRNDSFQELQCDSCQKHFNYDSGNAINVCQNGITISFCSNACMMGVCAFCKDPKLKTAMFEIHNRSDCIEMACTLKCLTLLGETESDGNGVDSLNISPAVAREKSLSVPDPTVERLPSSVSMLELIVSTMQPVLIICVEILHHILVHKNIVSDANDSQSSVSDFAVVVLDDGGEGDTESDASAGLGNRSKRLFADVDQDDIELDDDLAKRVKENEIADDSDEVLLSVIINDATSVEASLNDGDSSELTPSQMLQLFIDSDVVFISRNMDNNTLANESNDIVGDSDQLDAQSEDGDKIFFNFGDDSSVRNTDNVSVNEPNDIGNHFDQSEANFEDGDDIFLDLYDQILFNFGDDSSVSDTDNVSVNEPNEFGDHFDQSDAKSEDCWDTSSPENVSPKSSPER